MTEQGTLLRQRYPVTVGKLVLVSACLWLTAPVAAIGDPAATELAQWYEQAQVYYQSVQAGQTERPPVAEWQEFLEQMNWAHSQLNPGSGPHDQDLKGSRKSTRDAPAGTRPPPSQNKVMVMTPAVERPAFPCSVLEAPSAAATGSETGSITFGDGKRGRIPRTGVGGCGDAPGQIESANDTNAAKGDPDRPIVSGRVPNPDKEK